jgi:hypothetical protein
MVSVHDMEHILLVDRDKNGKFAAIINGTGDGGKEISARSAGNNTPKQAVLRVTRLFALDSPMFGTECQSLDDLK